MEQQPAHQPIAELAPDEVLASVAAVARLSLASRHASDALVIEKY